jgi:CheY-like chemotaxis protein
MDIQMPVMNGYEATRAIRQLENKKLANLPIIAMTANAFSEDVQAAKNAGMNGHIAKPIDVQKMMEVLADFLK